MSSDNSTGYKVPNIVKELSCRKFSFIKVRNILHYNLAILKMIPHFSNAKFLKNEALVLLILCTLNAY